MSDDVPPRALIEALRRMGLLPRAAGAPPGSRLTGGVSSDIWRLDLPARSVCIKRALPRLRVAAAWEAPVERNRFEAAWMRFANAAVPGCAPSVLGDDAETGSFAMDYLPPARFPLWKAELRAGRADPAFAGAVGATLVRLHAASAADPARIAPAFATDRIFAAIRLEPYLLAAAAGHADLAAALAAIAAETAATHRALVHGDVSPKNILCGPGGPVLLDAECAWWGDPAFDLAFCLNHLLLKCLWVPAASAGLLDCFAALAARYLRGVGWEPAEALEARAARLLPGLMLARVDGKSPVEYITSDAARGVVRRVARALLADPPARLPAIARTWRRELAGP